MENPTVRRRVEEQVAKIKSRDYTLGIMGMGYVGLPLALAAIKAGFRVIGLDTDERRVAQLNAGDSGMKHVPGNAIVDALKAGKFRATADFSELPVPDAILIAVPTPLSRHREPDLSYVENSTRAIAKALRRDQLVVLEFDHMARHHSRSDAADPRGGRTQGRPGLLSWPSRRSARIPATRTSTRRRYQRWSGPMTMLLATGRRALRGFDCEGRAGVVGRDGRGRQAHREHLPLGQHCTR